MHNELPEEVLELIIRFTASIPDLTLQIDSPKTTSAVALKQLIRPHLPSKYGDSRLRLISSGKILEDAISLHQSLGLKAPPPPPPPKSDKAKGKEPIRSSVPVTVRQRYIHCSLGDPLSPIELAEESSAAEAAKEALLDSLEPASAAPSSTTQDATPAETPVGFDRLLQTGFTAEDIATLRASFLTHLSYTHTPDTMPHGDALRRMEERWLDTDSANTSGGADDPEALDDDESGMLDDMFWGNVFGFFWPFGALVWGIREDGVWTRRRKYLVAAGLLTNVFFGFARLISSRPDGS